MKYTKGPWKRHDVERNVIVGEDHKSIADVDSTSRKDEENQANARLIAAAPELLEACKNLKLFYMTLSHMNPNSFIALKKILPKEIINKMEQAIAKAEGGR